MLIRRRAVPLALVALLLAVLLAPSAPADASPAALTGGDCSGGLVFSNKLVAKPSRGGFEIEAEASGILHIDAWPFPIGQAEPEKPWTAMLRKDKYIGFDAIREFPAEGNADLDGDAILRGLYVSARGWVAASALGKPGDKVKVDFFRDGKKQAAEAELGQR